MSFTILWTRSVFASCLDQQSDGILLWLFTRKRILLNEDCYLVTVTDIWSLCIVWFDYCFKLQGIGLYKPEDTRQVGQRLEQHSEGDDIVVGVNAVITNVIIGRL